MHIALEEGAVCHVGGAVRGHVAIEVDAPTVCRALLLELHRFVVIDDYEAQRTQVTLERQSLFEGEWSEGSYVYDFEVAAPEDLPTYNGASFGIIYRVTARAQLATGEREAEAVIDIVAPPERVLAVGDESFSGAQEVTGWSFIGAGLMLFAVVVLSQLVGPSSSSDEASATLFMSLAMFATFGMGARMTYVSVRPALAGWRLGGVDMDVAVGEDDAGYFVDVRAHVAPHPRVEIRSATVALRREEVTIVKTGGGNTRVKRHERIHVCACEEAELNPQPTATGEGAPDQRVRLRLPEEPVPTLSDAHVSMRWRVALHIDIVDWPDYIEEVPIVVLAKSADQLD